MVIGDEVSNRGYWKFPEFLLQDPNYVASLPNVITQCVNDNTEANPGLQLDTVKMALCGFTIDYLTACKKKCKMKIESVETDIYHASHMRNAMENVDPELFSIYVQQIANLQKELDVIL